MEIAIEKIKDPILYFDSRINTNMRKQKVYEGLTTLKICFAIQKNQDGEDIYISSEDHQHRYNELLTI